MHNQLLHKNTHSDNKCVPSDTFTRLETAPFSVWTRHEHYVYFIYIMWLLSKHEKRQHRINPMAINDTMRTN